VDGVDVEDVTEMLERMHCEKGGHKSKCIGDSQFSTIEHGISVGRGGAGGCGGLHVGVSIENFA